MTREADEEEVGVRGGGSVVLGRSLEEAGGRRLHRRPDVTSPYPSLPIKQSRLFPTMDAMAFCGGPLDICLASLYRACRTDHEYAFRSAILVRWTWPK
jgi:hypothetical protein